MDFSALIFVALAVAWGAYLIPKALRHHEQVQRTRSVENFSARMRVLARREPTSSSHARLVLTQERPASAPQITTKGSPTSAARVAARRAASARAAKRRRRVLSAILLVLVATIALAAFSIFSWWYVAIPATLLVAWLVACRLMVKRARSVWVPSTRRDARTSAAPDEGGDADDTQSVPVVVLPMDTEPVAESTLADDDPSRWDLRPVTLPTYVGKPIARRTVQTIDLDSTGVWSSGRNVQDSALARQAEAERAEAERAQAEAGTAPQSQHA